MRFKEQGYEIRIWNEITQHDGLAVVMDLPGQPTKMNPIQITVHVDATAPIETIEAAVTVND